MKRLLCSVSRREFLSTSVLTSSGLILGARSARSQSAPARAGERKKALIAITLDLEMARNFPAWEDTHWDYEKGNLNEQTKRYAVEAARRVKAHGGVIHFFLVGQALEQENVDWLKELAAEGHRIGNHTYDHVYLLATTPDEIQFRFRRAPWLIGDRTCPEVIRDNIQITNRALQNRLGIRAAGFRAPGGFAEGLIGRTDIQQMLIDAGFGWASCKYPAHPYGEVGQAPAPEVFAGIVQAQAAAQPFRYPTGLLEIPMSPISDVGAFRNGRWQLEHYLQAVALGVQWAIDHQGVFDFLAHPSVLYPNDPGFAAIELICDLVQKAGDRASIVDLDTIAREAMA